MLPIEKVQIPIAALGAAKTQKTLGVIAMKLNHVVKTNFHEIPKITNEILTKPTDVSQLRYVNPLQFPNPTFNVPGERDLLVGADMLEEVMLDNRNKDKGVVIRETLCLRLDCFWACPKTRIGEHFSTFSQYITDCIFKLHRRPSFKILWSRNRSR